MATRFYFVRTETPNPTNIFVEVSPEWDIIPSTARRLLSIDRPSGTLGTWTSFKGAANRANQDVIWVQYVSDPVGAGTLSGTFRAQIQAVENNAAINARAQIIVKVVSEDGSVLRGYAYGGDLQTGTTNPTNEFGTSYANRYFPRSGSTALSSIQLQNGDRIVVEVGYRVHATITTDYSASMRFGNGGAADLPIDQTTTATTFTPWIEFSQNFAPYQLILPVDLYDTVGLAVTEDFAVPVRGRAYRAFVDVPPSLGVIASDPRVLSATETRITTAWITPSDARTISGSESFGSLRVSTHADNGSIQSSEQFSVQSSVQSNDTNSLSVSESFNRLEYLDLYDYNPAAQLGTFVLGQSRLADTSYPLVAQESFDVQLSQTMALFDNRALGAAESRSILTDATLSRTDSGTLSSSENFTVLTDSFFSRTDAGTIGRVESIAPWSTLSLADLSLMVAAAETYAEFGQDTFDGADAAVIAEISSVSLSVARSLTDTRTVTASEDAAILTDKYSTHADASIMSSSESFSTYTQRSLTDTRTITESPNFSTYTARTLSDNRILTVTEEQTRSSIVSLSAVEALSISESLSSQSSPSRSDSGTIAPSEIALSAATLAPNDSNTLSGVESRVIYTDALVALTDAVSVGSNESASVSAQIVLSRIAAIGRSESLAQSSSLVLLLPQDLGSDEEAATEATLSVGETDSVVAAESLNAMTDDFLVTSDHAIIHASEVSSRDTQTIYNDSGPFGVEDIITIITGSFVSVSDTRTLASARTFSTSGIATRNISEPFAASEAIDVVTGNFITRSDNPPLSEWSLTEVDTQQSVNDSGFVSASENRTIVTGLFLSRVDTAFVGASESFATYATTSRADTALLSSVENRTQGAYAVVVDGSSVTSTETSQHHTVMSLGDTRILSESSSFVIIPLWTAHTREDVASLLSSEQFSVYGEGTSEFADSHRISSSDVSGFTAQSTLTDSHVLSSSRQLSAQTSIASSDARTITSNEASIVGSTINVNPLYTISSLENMDITSVSQYADADTLTEQNDISLVATRSDTDSGTFVGTELFQTATTVSQSDLSMVGVDESLAILTSSSPQFYDSGSFSRVESFSVFSYITQTIVPNVHGVEVVGTSSVVQSSDDVSLTSVDEKSVEGDAFEDRADGGRVSSQEVRVASSTILWTEQWNPLVSEHFHMYHEDEHADSATISAAESFGIVSYVTRTDARNIVANEHVSLAATHISSDTSILSDLHQLSVAIFDIDTLSTSDIFSVTSSPSWVDSGSITSIDAYDILENETVERSDEGTFVAVESLSILARPSLSDARRISASEARSAESTIALSRNSVIGSVDQYHAFLPLVSDDVGVMSLDDQLHTLVSHVDTFDVVPFAITEQFDIALGVVELLGGVESFSIFVSRVISDSGTLRYDDYIHIQEDEELYKIDSSVLSVAESAIIESTVAVAQEETLTATDLLAGFQPRTFDVTYVLHTAEDVYTVTSLVSEDNEEIYIEEASDLRSSSVFEDETEIVAHENLDTSLFTEDYLSVVENLDTLSIIELTQAHTIQSSVTHDVEETEYVTLFDAGAFSSLESLSVFSTVVSDDNSLLEDDDALGITSNATYSSVGDIFSNEVESIEETEYNVFSDASLVLTTEELSVFSSSEISDGVAIIGTETAYSTFSGASLSDETLLDSSTLFEFEEEEYPEFEEHSQFSGIESFTITSRIDAFRQYAFGVLDHFSSFSDIGNDLEYGFDSHESINIEETEFVTLDDDGIFDHEDVWTLFTRNTLSETDDILSDDDLDLWSDISGNDQRRLSSTDSSVVLSDIPLFDGDDVYVDENLSIYTFSTHEWEDSPYLSVGYDVLVKPVKYVIGEPREDVVPIQLIRIDFLPTLRKSLRVPMLVRVHLDDEPFLIKARSQTLQSVANTPFLRKQGTIK